MNQRFSVSLQKIINELNLKTFYAPRDPAQMLIFSMDINRPEKYGGPVSYDSYEALTKDYFTVVDGKALLSPMDLKDGVADGMSKCLAPVAEYFEQHPENYNAMIEVLKKLGKL